MLGAIVGDIVGSVYEFNNIKTREFPLFDKRSEFTDDSVMTLAVARALLDSPEGEGLSASVLVNAMQVYGHTYPWAGYGGRFAQWLRKDHPEPYYSCGNGSAMRVSPVAWICDTLDEVDALAAASAQVTHNHVEGIRGAQATAACILLARQGADNDAIRALVRSRYGYALDFTLDEIRPTYDFDVSCQGSVPQAIEAFLESDGFEDSIRKAISIGGDSDTIAAITASIAQGRYGVPRAIENKLRNLMTPDLLAVNDLFCATFPVK